MQKELKRKVLSEERRVKFWLYWQRNTFSVRLLPSLKFPIRRFTRTRSSSLVRRTKAVIKSQGYSTNLNLIKHVNIWSLNKFYISLNAQPHWSSQMFSYLFEQVEDWCGMKVDFSVCVAQRLQGLLVHIEHVWIHATHKSCLHDGPVLRVLI